MSDPFKGTTLQFCDVLGDAEPCFAWWPVRCFDRRWAWLCIVWRRLCILKPHLDHKGTAEPWYQYARHK